jgi:cellulose 1,4-beta-cellobiosidase
VRKHSRVFGAAVAALLASASALAAVVAPAVMAEAHQDNPYVGATQYVNSQWAAEVESEAVAQASNPTLAAKMRIVEKQATAVWLDSMGAINPSSGMGLAAHLNAAVAQKQGSTPIVINIVIYDLPGRDCNALASNGELPATQAGLTTYETQYIDPIATILSNSAYSGLRIVLIVEPDSLPNIVTNSGVAACQTAGPLYEAGIEYALNKFHAISNVYNYLDSAHSGWLGWSSNSGPAAQEFAKVANATTARFASIDGFVTDTANTTPLKEPFITGTTTVNGQQAISANFYQYNPDVDEQSFTADMYPRLVSAGFPSSIGMLIDTSRNGWGGPNRPSAPSTSTDVNTWVDATRVDRRPHRGAWCNPSGAGIGELPRATPGGYPNSHLDAFIWVKPPGESDGSSTAIPNDQGKGFDRMCDPTYQPPGAGWNGATTGALPNAPLSGQWFPAQFDQLVTNAYPVIGSNPSTPTPPASSSVGPSASPTATAIRTASPTPIPPTQTPIVSTGPGTCSASFHLDNSWGSGFQGTVTVTAGSSAISSWRVTWSWPGSQSIVNYWNAAVTSSGSAVTANNLSYNGSIGAGGNTAFGLQVNGSAVTPTLSCAANGGVTPTPSATPVITPSATPVRTSTPVITPSATPVRTSTPVITPSATPVRTSTPVITPSGSTRSCSASLHVDSSWGSGFTATVTVTNTGTSPTAGWRVTWTWPGSQSFVNYWNASISQSGSAVTATNLSYNGSIAAGGSTTFGMQLNGSSATPALTCTAS